MTRYGELAAKVGMGQRQGDHRDQSSCLASVLTGNYRALSSMEIAAKSNGIARRDIKQPQATARGQD